MMSNDYVKAKRSVLEGCLTCPLCRDLIREATAISPCLHTFCRECIYRKFEEDLSNNCPLCDVDLGSCPEAKLRPDHSLNGIRETLFPLKKSREPKNIAAPVKVKERSLSSLHIGPTTTRARGSKGKAAAVPSNPTMSKDNTDVMVENDHFEPSSSHAFANFSTGPKQPIISGEDVPSRDSQTTIGRSLHSQTSSGGKGNQAANWDGLSTTIGRSLHSQTSADRKGKQVAAWDGLSTTTGRSLHSQTSSDVKGKQEANCGGLSALAETANKRNDHVAGPLLGLPAFNVEAKNNVNLRDTKMRRRTRETMTEQMELEEAIRRSIISAASEKHAQSSVGAPELRNSREQAASAHRNSREQAASASTSKEPQDDPMRKLCPLWFTLVACHDKSGKHRYPQIPKPYIKIKDANMPVSFVNKYLVQKLNLEHESQVEVMCCGQTLAPSTPMISLVDIWLRFTSDRDRTLRQDSQNMQNFVMVLTYRRK